MRKRGLLAAVVAAVGGGLALPGSAAAATRPALLSVSIQGSAVVGQTLSATFEAAGDPLTTVEYHWRRCKADKPDDCGDIKDANAATYTVT
jgi:phosphoribosylcarboxyaminoimidazole (NCAIR) mutase